MKRILFLTLASLVLIVQGNTQNLNPNQLTACSYIGDINGDGIDDILMINNNQLTVSKVDVNRTTLLTHTFGATVKRLIIGDFVNSGRERGKKQIAAILNDGTIQAFAISDDLRSLWWWFTQPSFVADNEQFTSANFDGDVADELMVHNPTTGQIRFFKIQSNGGFAQMTNFDIGNLGGTSSAGTNLANVQILVGAFSSDHPTRKDLLVIDHSLKQMRLYSSVLQNNRLTFWWAYTTNGNLFPTGSQVCTANIDGGTRDGIVIRNGINGTYSIFKLDYGNGNLVPETGANTGQLPIRTSNSRVVAAKVRDAAFRNERGGRTRDDILVLQLSDNLLTRTDARFDGTNLTYWWAFNNTLPNNCSTTANGDANNWNFEMGDLRGWLKEGNAFDSQPTYGNIGFNRSGIPWGSNVSLGGDYWRDLTPQNEWHNGRQGNYWIGTSDNHSTSQIPYTSLQGDAPTGKLFSQEFRLNSKYVSFLMGGKSTSNGLCKVELLCFDDGSIQKTTSVLIGTDVSRYGIRIPIFQTITLPTRNIGGQSYIVVQSISSTAIVPTGATSDLNNSFFIRKYFQPADSLINKRARIAIIDDDVNGHINVDDIRFENELSPSPVDNTQTPLWGFVDMHTHPMSHLGFGRKIMHGQPDNPSDQTNIGAALGNCNATHGGWGIDNTGGNYIRMSILKMMDKKNPYNNGGIHELDHNHNGFPLYPNHASIAHQQMWHEWIERAHKGGLRVMIALAVNNYLLAEAVDGDTGYKKDKESADKQLEFMVEFVNRHPFMQIARSASEMRRIVSQGKLAVILGIELDNFGDFNDPTKTVNESTVKSEINRLFNEKGVRYIFPIHFADTKFGGCAIYSPSYLSNIASHFTRSFVNIAVTPPEAIANISGLKYVVEKAPDIRIKYRLTNPFEIDIPTAANTIIAGLRGLIELLEGQPNPCAGGFLDPIRGPICATAGIDLACPNLQCVLARKSEYRIVKNFMLTPSPEYEAYALTSGGHRNFKGITDLGIFAIKEMMRLGMMIDIDHMSEKTIESVLPIATLNDYPINSGHTGFRGNGGDSENTRTDEQLEIIRRTGGMMGVGIANNISPSFLHSYRYGMPKLNGITIGSDINGMEVMPKPRFSVNGMLILNNDQNYTPYPQDIRDRANNKVRYTNTNEGVNIPLTMSQTAGKTWNYNFDGMAHVGLYPDYLQDLKNLGMTNVERGRLFLGAEFFAQMWEKCERQRANIR